MLNSLHDRLNLALCSHYTDFDGGGGGGGGYEFGGGGDFCGGGFSEVIDYGGDVGGTDLGSGERYGVEYTGGSAIGGGSDVLGEGVCEITDTTMETQDSGCEANTEDCDNTSVSIEDEDELKMPKIKMKKIKNNKKTVKPACVTYVKPQQVVPNVRPVQARPPQQASPTSHKTHTTNPGDLGVSIFHTICSFVHVTYWRQNLHIYVVHIKLFTGSMKMLLT